MLDVLLFIIKTLFAIWFFGNLIFGILYLIVVYHENPKRWSSWTESFRKGLDKMHFW